MHTYQNKIKQKQPLTKKMAASASMNQWKVQTVQSPLLKSMRIIYFFVFRWYLFSEGKTVLPYKDKFVGAETAKSFILC